MKILKNENEQEYIYIQIHDLKQIKHLCSTIPMSIYSKIIQYSNSLNNCDFILFTNKKAVEFLKGLEWIIDYQLCDNMNVDDLTREIRKAYLKLALILDNKDKRISRRDKEEGTYMYDAIKYKLDSINMFLKIKKGKLKISMPNEQIKEKVLKRR